MICSALAALLEEDKGSERGSFVFGCAFEI